MKKFLKRPSTSHVWHFPNIGKSRRYPRNISMSMCGTLYNNVIQSVTWPMCKRCSNLEEMAFPSEVKVKLPKAIREQSFEPPQEIKCLN